MGLIHYLQGPTISYNKLGKWIYDKEASGETQLEILGGHFNYFL